MSLAEGNARFLLRGETDVADLHGFDPDPAQDEFAIDGFAHADVHDLSVAGKRGDRTRGRSERADVAIRELRRNRSHRLWRRLRDRGWWRRLHHDLPRRWWRGGRRLLVCEAIALTPVAPALAIQPLRVNHADAGSRRGNGSLRWRRQRWTRLGKRFRQASALRRRERVDREHADENRSNHRPGFPVHPIHHISLFTTGGVRGSSRNSVFSLKFNVRFAFGSPEPDR